MNATVLQITLPFLFALLALPLILRFVIGRIILVVVKKRYVNQISEDIAPIGIEEEALKSTLSILLKKLNYPFIQKYDLKNELISIILAVQNSYKGTMDEELKFTFSISDLIKCYFLLMTDLNKIINNAFWFDKVKKSKIATLKKINKISGYYNYLYEKIPFLKILRKGRITGKIIRILLIPILGLPSIVLSIFVSIVSLFFTEIIWKYYYSVLLIKCCYYAIILYGHKSSLLKEKIEEFPLDKIKKMSLAVEELISPHNSMFRSDLFETSFVEYQRVLEKFGISPEKDIDFDGIKYRFNKKRKIFKKVFKIPFNVVKNYNPFFEKNESHKEQILYLIKSIAAIYSDKENVFDDLRVMDLFEILYMISVLSYNKLLMGSVLFDNLSVDFALKAKDISDEIFNEVLENTIPRYKQIYRSYKLIRKSRVLYKAIRSTNPVGFILSFTGPIAFEGIKEQLVDYIYQRTGRFTIYCYESNILKRDHIFFIPDEI